MSRFKRFLSIALSLTLILTSGLFDGVAHAHADVSLNDVALGSESSTAKERVGGDGEAGSGVVSVKPGGAYARQCR